MPFDHKGAFASELSTKEIAAKLRPYAKPDNRKAFRVLAATAIPLFAIFNLMWLSLAYVPYIVTAAMGVIGGLFLVRLFLIFHDAGHYSFLETKAQNVWLGRIIGPFVFSPFDDWRHDHSLHHTWSGNLDHRGFGDIPTLTLEEYLGRSTWGRVRYWIFRQPPVTFCLFPLYQFLLRHRVPTYWPKNWMPILSTQLTNLAIIAFVVASSMVMGFTEFLLVFGPITLASTACGVWLFFVQHQFEETYWARHPDWNPRDAAFHGSSYYVLPQPLRWFTCDAGAHHIHHLSSRVPMYNLGPALRDIPELSLVPKLYLGESLSNARFALWDEENKELVNFAHARRVRAARTMGVPAE